MHCKIWLNANNNQIFRIFRSVPHKTTGENLKNRTIKGNSESVMLPSGSLNSKTHALRVEAAGAFPHPLSPDLVLGCEVC
jgi:hypothetical protein